MESAIAKQTKYGRIRSAFRRFWMMYWPAREDCLLLAREPYMGDNKRRKWSYRCAACNVLFIKDDIEVNHIKACGQFLGPDDEQQFVYNLLFGKLEALCKPCHKNVTRMERKK